MEALGEQQRQLREAVRQKHERTLLDLQEQGEL